MITKDSKDIDNEYIVIIGDPYLTTDLNGNYVVLQDEYTFLAPIGKGVDLVYETEALVDSNPTEEEIFRLKLKGAVRTYKE